MNTRSENDENNRRKGILASVLFHAVLVILMILPLLTYQNPPPGQQGITVNLGDDFGQGFENVEVKEPEPEPEPEPVEEVEEVVEEVIEEPVIEEETPNTELVETVDTEAIRLAEEQKEKERREAEKQAQREKARQEREAAEAKKRADAQNKFKGIGAGKGNTGKTGNQGDELGDPNSDNLDGAAKGNGQVGGGLGDRGVGSRPEVSNNTSKVGVVVVKLCVDASGKVIPSTVRYTSAGSTTQDSRLKSIAIANAKRWKFAASSKNEECGTISYKFEN